MRETANPSAAAEKAEAILQTLGDLIEVQSVEVENQDSTLRVTVSYLVRRTQILQQAQFTQGAEEA